MSLKSEVSKETKSSLRHTISSGEGLQALFKSGESAKLLPFLIQTLSVGPQKEPSLMGSKDLKSTYNSPEHRNFKNKDNLVSYL